MAEASQLAQIIQQASADQSAMQPETFANPLVRGMIDSLVTLPKRALQASAGDLGHLGDHSYTPQSIAPAVEAAMMMTGGAGAIPAEANSLRAGIRPYGNVPDSLMGYRRAGPQKGFEETNYPHTQDVQVVFPDREVMSDQIKGMNPDHAIERAYRNWQDAIHIFAPNKT